MQHFEELFPHSRQALEKHLSHISGKGNKFSSVIAETFQDLPKSYLKETDNGVVQVQFESSLTSKQKEKLHSLITELGPWRKGPFQVDDLLIDSEWRSDLKWSRVLKDPKLDLENKRVADIGCNNGYFMFRMLPYLPKAVVGFDPIPLFFHQFEMIQAQSNTPSLHYLQLGQEYLENFSQSFEIIFHFGVLYHHWDPLGQLKLLRQAMVPGGALYLETIGIPGDDFTCYSPASSYAGMKKVYFLPTLKTLMNWLERTQFSQVEVLSTKWQYTEEQRSTPFSSPVSYKDQLNPDDYTQTKEGCPRPERFLLKAIY